MNRPMLPTHMLSPEVVNAQNNFYPEVVKNVSQAIEKDKVVVIGMSGNPFVKKAVKALEQAGVEFRYIGYGSYFSQWKQRLAIKLWTGWPTFPQVFVRGVLIGGATDTIKALENGRLQKLLQGESTGQNLSIHAGDKK